LPHLNPGVMDEAWLKRLRKVSVSQGIMLETASDRLSERGERTSARPTRFPAVRLATLEAAGRARVPFTTGILIGIGETRPSASRRCSPSATRTSGTATSRRSSSRTSAPSPARA
jgi:2-iminoacetate synthase ThiH